MSPSFVREECADLALDVLRRNHENADFAVEPVAQRWHAWWRDPLSAVDAQIDLMDASANRYQKLPQVAPATNERHGLPVAEITHDLDGLDAADPRRDALKVRS